MKLTTEKIKDRRQKLISGRPREENLFQSLLDKALWSFKPITFKYKCRPQKIVNSFGQLFYMDFFLSAKRKDSPQKQILICFEIDGPYHLSKSVKERDDYRARFIREAENVEVVRFTNDEINFTPNTVFEKLRNTLQQKFNILTDQSEGSETVKNSEKPY